MRILQITPAYYPSISWGGPIVSVHLLNRELVKQGNEVMVYTTTFGLVQNETQKNVIDGVKIIYLKSFKFGKWLVPLGLKKQIFKTIDNFDIVHIHQIWDPICWLSELFLIKKRKSFIISPRGSIDPVLIRKKSYFLKKIIYALFIKKIFKNASGFHFTSNYEKEQFMKIYQISNIKNDEMSYLISSLKNGQSAFSSKNDNSKFKIIFNPLDTTEFQKDVDTGLLDKWNLTNKQYVLFLGRLNWKKGIEFLINAFAKFVHDNPRAGQRESAYSPHQSAFMLVIAGPDENNFKSNLEKLIKERGISDKVIFTGLVKGDDKLVLLKNAKMFVLSSYGENFGIAVAEAMAAGTPVIVSKFVGLVDIIEKYKAGLITELRETELADKMKELTLNQILREELKNNGLKLTAEQFNPRAVAEQILEFYEAIK